MPKLKGKKYAYTKKGKEAYKKALTKSKKKKLKKTLAKDFKDIDVYLPPKRGSDPKSLRDIGHMFTRNEPNQSEHGHLHQEGHWNTPESKEWRKTIPKKIRGHKYRLTKRGKMKYYDDSE